MSEQSTGIILQRGKQQRVGEESMEGETPLIQDSQKQWDTVQQMTTNSALASQFPEWDLKPPAGLLKRRSSKLL